MDKTILPAKYIDCVKTLVYVDGKYQLSLNFNNVIATSYYYESTSKKAVLDFLRHKMYYIPWLYKAKYARDTVNTINRYRFNSNIFISVYFNLRANEFITHVDTNVIYRYEQNYIILVNRYCFVKDNKIDKDTLINDTIQALYNYFC